MPECGYCKDCKWWDEATLFARGWHICAMMTKAATLLKVIAYWQGGVTTAPDFGCVQFEAKA